MTDSAEAIRSALACMEKHRPPRAGIREVFGEDYPTECRKAVEAAVKAGWIQPSHPDPNATCAPTCGRPDPFRHMRRKP